MRFLGILILTLSFPLKLSAQEYNSFYQSLTDMVQKDNIVNHLQEFQDLGIKNFGSAGADNTVNWLKDFYQAWGYTAVEEQQMSFYGSTSKNLIVTKMGTVYPDQYIVMGAHYDSTNNGPGVNDNGTGTAILLEMARILKDVPTEYSIKFIHFTGEEYGLIGSTYYVENTAVPQNLDIKLMFNIDEVGGVVGMINDTVVCEYDQSAPNHNNDDSWVATQQLGVCMELYSDLNTDFFYAYSSDYMPFQNEGYVITGLYEYNESPYAHTSDDVLDNLDTEYVYQVAKGALGALCFFANAYQNMNVNDSKLNSVRIYPNPAKSYVYIEVSKADEYNFQLTDLNGRILRKGFFNGQSYSLDVSKLKKGVYILNLKDKHETISEKLIISE